MRTFAASLILALLAACGQTGDLYLPHKTPEPSAPEKDSKKTPPVPQPTPAPSQPLPDTSRPPSTAPKP
jgi:predicted small lipoprotein YifL